MHNNAPCNSIQNGGQSNLKFNVREEKKLTVCLVIDNEYNVYKKHNSEAANKL